jgi:hypothetical protein
MTEMLNIIEPTLESEVGHCYSFVASLCHASGGHPVTVWCGRRAKIVMPVAVDIRRMFYRRIRRVQAFLLYRALLRQSGRIFVSTAGRTDLILLNLASSGEIAPNKVFLYIHWSRHAQEKRGQLQKLANRQPGIIILTPTATVYEEFRAAGFINTRLVPYPITPSDKTAFTPQQKTFSHILFAGAARRDKGFSEVVDFVALLSSSGEQIPITLQTSASHYSKYDETTKRDLARLDETGYHFLKRLDDALQPHEYLDLFAGAICLQLYSQQDFADRISGVTLDALTAGSPVVTLSGTWMDRVVTEFNAGVVIDLPIPEAVLKAVTTIMNRYEFFRDNALKAGSELQKRNNAEYLFRELML